MKAILLISVFYLTQPAAHADTWFLQPEEDFGAKGEPVLEPVQAERLRLLGRGLKNSESQESIALACVDDTCNRLRFVYFRNPQEAFFTGKTYSVKKLSPSQVQKLIEESIKGDDPVAETVRSTLKTREIFDWNGSSQEERVRYVQRADRRNLFKRIGFMLATFGGVAGGAAIMIVAPGAAIVGLAVIIGSGIYGVKLNMATHTVRMEHKVRVIEKRVRVRHRPKVRNYREMTVEVFKQGSWNWASEPSKIPAEQFRKVLESLND